MRTPLGIIIIFLTICCKSQEINWRQYVQEVDALPVSKSIYLFEVNSQKNILDTTAIRKFKYKNDDLIYEENIQLQMGYISQNYYNSNGLNIYSKITVGEEVLTEFIASVEKGRIVSALHFGYLENEITDTIQMKYEYIMEESKLTKMIIHAGDEFHTTEFYNEWEKPILNFTAQKNDTIERNEFIYDQENNLIQKNYKNFQSNEEEIYYYQKDKIVKETIVIEGIIKLNRYYSEDKHGNILRFTEEKSVL